MDLVLKGRGTRITEQVRRQAGVKLAKLSRLYPRAGRIEVEVISERNPRVNGTKRVEASLETPRRTFRASARAADVDAALDLLVSRLERQVRDDRTRRRKRLSGGGNRLKSPRTGPE